MMDYRESVLQYADDQDQLDADIVTQLLEEHSTSIQDLLDDGFPECHVTNAQELLNWMGY